MASKKKVVESTIEVAPVVAENPEVVAENPEAVEVVLKRDLIHWGILYKSGTKLVDVPNLHAGNIAFLRRVGTI